MPCLTRYRYLSLFPPRLNAGRSRCNQARAGAQTRPDVHGCRQVPSISADGAAALSCPPAPCTATLRPDSMPPTLGPLPALNLGPNPCTPVKPSRALLFSLRRVITPCMPGHTILFCFWPARLLFYYIILPSAALPPSFPSVCVRAACVVPPPPSSSHITTTPHCIEPDDYDDDEHFLATCSRQLPFSFCASPSLYRSLFHALGVDRLFTPRPR